VAAIQIRNALEHERPEIQALVIAAYEQFTAELPPPMWDFYRSNIERTMAAAGLDQLLVAISPALEGETPSSLRGGLKDASSSGGGIAGSVLLYENAEDYLPEWWSVRLLAVHPDARGQGIGRLLMEECVRRAREGGAKVLGLHTTDMMAVAQAMYGRMGFERVPELDFQLPEYLIKAYRLDL
jgi:GNAT superfamily N-acetyltransferase